MNLDGVQNAKFTPCGVMKIVVPLVERLEAVHETVIESVCSRCDETEKCLLDGIA